MTFQKFTDFSFFLRSLMHKKFNSGMQDFHTKFSIFESLSPLSDLNRETSKPLLLYSSSTRLRSSSLQPATTKTRKVITETRPKTTLHKVSILGVESLFVHGFARGLKNLGVNKILWKLEILEKFIQFLKFNRFGKHILVNSICFFTKGQ